MQSVIEFCMPAVGLVAWTIANLALAVESSDKYSSQPLSERQAQEYQLDASFYKKCTDVQGILIATSHRVSDLAHREAAYQFDMIMQSINAEIANRIRESKVLCILIGHQERTSQIPQFATKKTGKELDFYNWRQRGFLTRLKNRPTVVFAEEDVLEYEGGMQLESILIHEFGHVIHSAGFDDKLQQRLTHAFQRARAGGLWNDGRAAQRFRRVKSDSPVRLLDALIESFPEQSPELLKKCLDKGDILVNGKATNSRVQVTKHDKVLIVFGGDKECYAHKNRAEYWAEGVQCWYDTNRTMDHDHNHIHTREQLIAYDPALGELCKDVLGESEWRFVSPRQRAGKGHLKDFDPEKSPKVVDPQHIQEAAYDYYDHYWNTYWQRLQDKHALDRELKSESVTLLVKASREQGNAVRGAILFAQQKLECTNCHAPGSRDLLGPDLNTMGEKTTDTYLVESILYPSKEIKKGFETVTVITVSGKSHSGRIVEDNNHKLVIRDTSKRQLIQILKTEIEEIVQNESSSMPDGLVNQMQNRQEFLDLLKYMIEIKSVATEKSTSTFVQSRGGSRISEELRGMVLLDDFHCTACHRNDLLKSSVRPQQAPYLAWGIGRIDPLYLERFIAHPNKTKPQTTMPDVMQSMDEDARKIAAREITHFLVSRSDKAFRRQPLDAPRARHGNELYHSVGCVACHSPRNEDGVEQLPQVSIPLGMLEQKYSLDGLVEFLENPHASRPSGRMPKMQLSHWEAMDIAHYLLSRTSQAAATDLFVLDTQLVKKGKAKFTRLECSRCHTNDGEVSARIYPSLSQLRTDQGCLSEETGEWPRFEFSESQRVAIRAAIARGPNPLTEQQRIALTLTTFQCLACHQRGDLGGVSPERNEYFHTTNPNLGPQGRLPPPLTRVGAKLKPQWMRQVLVSGRAIRPYMKTRMPQYGSENVEHLVDLLQRVDQLADVSYANFPDRKQIRNAGHEMAGNRGLNCIACHTFQQKRAETMPAVDLTEMAERLHKNWFYHYLRDPQRFSANTVMPSFWPGGRAIRKDILSGDANLQIEALWQFLLDGRQARTPRGLMRQPIQLVATDEAVMLRRNYPGIGKRGIGVGYPSQVNLAFDAEQMRLAMIWKGKFADLGGVFSGQGSGTVRPMGSDLIHLSAGPELDDARTPWIVDDGRPPRHQFKGYYLDKQQRPTFIYRFDNVDVEDYPIDVVDESSGKTIIRRSLTFFSAEGRENLVFRAAVDPQIVAEDKGTFLIGKSLRICVDDQYHGQIHDTSTGKQLRIPMRVGKNPSKLVLEYAW